MLIEQKVHSSTSVNSDKNQFVFYNPYKKASRSIDKVIDLKDSTGARAHSITKAVSAVNSFNLQDGVAIQLSNQRPKVSKLSLTTFLKARQNNSASFTGVSTGGQDQKTQDVMEVQKLATEAVIFQEPAKQEGKLVSNVPRRPLISTFQVPQTNTLFSSLSGIVKKTQSRAHSRSMSRDQTQETVNAQQKPQTAIPQVGSQITSVLTAAPQRPLMPRTPVSTAPFSEAAMRYPKPTSVAPRVKLEDIDSILRTSLHSKHSRLSSLTKHLPSFMRSSSSKGLEQGTVSSPVCAPTYYMRHMLLHLKYEHSKSGHRARQHFREVYAHLQYVKTLRKPSDETLIKSQFRCIPNDVLTDGKKSKTSFDLRKVHTDIRLGRDSDAYI